MGAGVLSLTLGYKADQPIKKVLDSDVACKEDYMDLTFLIMQCVYQFICEDWIRDILAALHIIL